MTTFLPKLYPLILLLLGVSFVVTFLGYAPLFDGSEIRFAEAAREMLTTNTFSYAQLDFLPDYATPPLFPWLQALSMRIFGVADKAELAARLPSALMGLVTLLTLFYIGRRKHDARFGFLWALSYVGTVVPLMLAKSALPATTGQFFNFLGILYLLKLIGPAGKERAVRNAGLAGLFFGLGLLTTGGFVVSLLILFFVLLSYRQTVGGSYSFLKRKELLILFGCLILTASPWLFPGLINSWVNTLKPPVNASVVLFGVVLLSVQIIRFWQSAMAVDKDVSTKTGDLSEQQAGTILRNLPIVMLLSTDVILLIWFFITYLITCAVHHALTETATQNRALVIGLLGWGMLAGLLMVAVCLVGMNPDWLARRTSDPYWVGITEAPVNWEGWEWGIGGLLMVSTLLCTLALYRRPFESIIGLYGSTAVCTLAFLAVVVPKIEQYLQGPLIDYCESKWNQPVYIQPSFPSYAHLFYTRKKPPVNPDSRRIDWLVNGPVDKPTFIISRATEAAIFRYNPNLVLESEDYGYVFFRRRQYR